MYTARFATIRNIRVFLPDLCSWAQDELEQRRRPSIIIGVWSDTFKETFKPQILTKVTHLQHREHPGCHDKPKRDAQGVANHVGSEGENAEEEVGREADDQQEIVQERNRVRVDVSLGDLVIEGDARQRHGEEDGTFHRLCHNDVGFNVASIVQNIHCEAGGEGEKDEEDPHKHAFR